MKRTSVGSGGQNIKAGTIRLIKSDLYSLIQKQTLIEIAIDFEVSIQVVQRVYKDFFKNRAIGFTEDKMQGEDELNTFGAWDELRRTKLYKQLTKI